MIQNIIQTKKYSQKNQMMLKETFANQIYMYQNLQMMLFHHFTFRHYLAL